MLATAQTWPPCVPQKFPAPANPNGTGAKSDDPSQALPPKPRAAAKRNHSVASRENSHDGSVGATAGGGAKRGRSSAGGGSHSQEFLAAQRAGYPTGYEDMGYDDDAAMHWAASQQYYGGMYGGMYPPTGYGPGGYPDPEEYAACMANYQQYMREQGGFEDATAVIHRGSGPSAAGSKKGDGPESRKSMAAAAAAARSQAMAAMMYESNPMYAHSYGGPYGNPYAAMSGMPGYGSKAAYMAAYGGRYPGGQRGSPAGPGFSPRPDSIGRGHRTRAADDSLPAEPRPMDRGEGSQSPDPNAVVHYPDFPAYDHMGGYPGYHPAMFGYGMPPPPGYGNTPPGPTTGAVVRPRAVHVHKPDYGVPGAFQPYNAAVAMPPQMGGFYGDPSAPAADDDDDDDENRMEEAMAKKWHAMASTVNRSVMAGSSGGGALTSDAPAVRDQGPVQDGAAAIVAATAAAVQQTAVVCD